MGTIHSQPRRGQWEKPLSAGTATSMNLEKKITISQQQQQQNSQQPCLPPCHLAFSKLRKKTHISNTCSFVPCGCTSLYSEWHLSTLHCKTQKTKGYKNNGTHNSALRAWVFMRHYACTRTLTNLPRFMHTWDDLFHLYICSSPPPLFLKKAHHKKLFIFSHKPQVLQASWV